MPRWRLFYHLVWATKDRSPWLAGEARRLAHELIRGKAIGLGATVYAVGGVADHVHVVASIPPALAVARFVGQVKGSSSARLNQAGVLADHFAWQDEYGAFSFDEKRLPPVVRYVENQERHHTETTLIMALEP